MTQAEMERVLENLDRRLSNVERILPTLATKEDFAEAKRHASVLFESLKGSLQLVAEDVIDLRGRFYNLETAVNGLQSEVGGISIQLTALVSRMERKGVI